MSGPRWLKRVRLAVYLVAGVLVAVLLLRYEALRLPAEGCSPLADFRPGTRLLLDRWQGVDEGDAVLFRHDGTLLLGRVGPFPDPRPADVPRGWAPFDESHLWIVADAPDCPAADSRSLGPIARADVVAVVAAGLPW